MIIVCFKILGCGSYDIDQESISFSIQNMYLGLPGVVGVLKILNQEFDFNLKKKNDWQFICKFLNYFIYLKSLVHCIVRS